jgi:hypothetical protein
MHALPISQVAIDIEIAQSYQRNDGMMSGGSHETMAAAGPLTAVNYTWTGYKFGQSSDWVSVFKPGSGSITIWENLNGVRGRRLYQLEHIPLTPGPLVVALKIAQDQDPHDSASYWPPTEADQLETISASYPPFTEHASVRLVNLVSDAKLVGMAAGGSSVSDVHYGLGSKWVKMPVGDQAFSFVDDDIRPPVPLLTTKVALQGPPIASTQFLMGLKHAPSTQLAVTSMLLNDAPEGGVCKPEGTTKRNKVDPRL